MSAPSNSPPPRSRRGLVIALAAVVVLAAGGYAGFEALRPVAVVEPVVSGRAIDAKPGSVTVAEDYALDIKAELGGRILDQDFNLRLGQTVRRNQPLLRLDPKDLELALAKTEIDYHATLARYQADQSQKYDLEAAKVDLANAERAHAIGSMSDQDLAAHQRSWDLALQTAKLDQINRQQVLETFENTIDTQKRQIEKMTLYAPVDGVVKAVMAHPGELIDANTPIATLITLKKNVVGKISDENFAEIRVGQKASVTFIPYGGNVFNGTVTQILPTTDPQTQRHIVYLDVTDIRPEQLIPGINGELSVTVGEHVARCVVPRRAVFTTDGDNVYVVQDGVVHRRRITEGYVWASGVEVLSGLEPGEQVIVEGLEDFRDGDHVRVQAVPSDVTHRTE